MNIGLPYICVFCRCLLILVYVLHLTFFFISLKKTIACLSNVPQNYLLGPWSRILLEKLTGSQLVKKFPVFYGTRRSTTAFTSALSLSCVKEDHFRSGDFVNGS